MEMTLDKFEEPVTKAVASAAIALTVTFGVAQIYPTGDLDWALAAVGFGSFFSGFFSSYE